MVLPAFFTSLNMGRKLPVEIHHKVIFDALAENSAKVEFNTPDGKECTGYLVKNKGNAPTDKIVIFVHGKSSNATWLLPYIQKLRMATDNIDFLTINLRGHGPDKPDEWLRTTTLGLKEAYDVTGAINYAAELGYTEVVVYGHSIGGAAVINAVGKYGNLISDRIRVKGVIVEKTFANLHDFLRRSHKNFFSDYGQNIYRALVGGTEFAKTHVEPTGLQAFGTSKLLEAMSGFKVSENNPSEAIKNIDAPVMVIGVEEGDVCMTRRDADVLAHNAKRGYKIMVSRPNDSLIERHSPEFNNPAVLANMMKFVEAVI